MKLLFFVRNIVINEKNKANVTKISHDFHEILYCTESNSQSITAGDLLFYPAGQEHCISYEKGNEIRLYQLYFSEELFSASVNIEKEALFILGQIKLYLKKGNLLRLSRIGSERILKLFESMRWEFTKRYRGYSWTIRLKLIELLVTVIRDREFKIPIRGEMGKPLSNSHIQDVLMYLEADYMNRITIENVLQFSPLSRSHFHALFKKETGETFIGYLNKLRCEKAGEMLVTTDETVLDISFKAGFNNLSHFCHTFKEIKGMPPTKFRSQAAVRQGVSAKTTPA
ncbi:MAG: AraC family transcriptional regulator [Spirochaetia bacterium]|jgi:AraC-like DNA-binding protein|nr:AraC family transcriptional regulator [Spirochaetia bacterium]